MLLRQVQPQPCALWQESKVEVHTAGAPAHRSPPPAHGVHDRQHCLDVIFREPAKYDQQYLIGQAVPLARKSSPFGWWWWWWLCRHFDEINWHVGLALKQPTFCSHNGLDRTGLVCEDTVSQSVVKQIGAAPI
jgi:hypothetical protein